MKKITLSVRCFLSIVLVLFSLNTFAEPKVTNKPTHRHSDTNLLLVNAAISLPSEGQWIVTTPTSDLLADITLQTPDLIKQRSLGLAQLRKNEKKQRNKVRYLFSQINREMDKSSKKNEGYSPKSIEQIEKNKQLKNLEVENVFLVPSLKIREKNNKNWKKVKTKEPVLIELNPLIDDGKHWVLYTNGRTELVKIDSNLIGKYKLTIKPQQKSIEQRFAEIGASVEYSILARLKNDAVISPQKVALKNLETNQEMMIDWKPQIDQQANSPDLMKQWATSRLNHWNDMLKQGREGYLPYWLEAGFRQYNLSQKDLFQESRRWTRRNANRSTNLFNVLGGRSAIRETLQLQRLLAEKKQNEEQSIPIESIKGVTVKSHPFKEMLAGKEGGSLELANYVPSDRFYAWFADPKDLTQYLNAGSQFIFNAGTSLLGKSNDNQLQQRYFKKLGVDSTWVEKFLSSGAITEMAVVLPDLFLLDGTDVSLIMRLQHAEIAKKLLALVGINPEKEMFALEHKNGKSYWSIKNDLLLVSTHQDELSKIQNVSTANSLGQSAEFKYMLTQLPIEKKSHSFFYFSDPFIRHLVSPKVKIAQLRRLQARAEMESAIAAGLLYKVDHGPNSSSTLEQLIQKKYMHAPMIVDDMKFAEDGSVSSISWGKPATMKTLLERPVNMVKASEKAAYKEYLRNYDRFWRQFFDPIAIRLNKDSEHKIEVSTFILPLINNSIYEELKEFIIADKNAKPLSIPTLTPEPVAQLSFNLNKKVWQSGMDKFLNEFFNKVVGVPSRVTDYFDSNIHLALADTDPIIEIGNGSLGGGFGMFSGSRRRMMQPALGFIGSLFTRPSAIMIGLTDAKKVTTILNQVSSNPRSLPRAFATNQFYRIAGKDAWHYVIDFEGVIKMRFGIEVKGNYLMITNQPLSYNPNIVKTDIALNNGVRLQLNPSAAIKQRASLYVSATQQQSKAAMIGINTLYPLMLSGSETIEDAKQQLKNQLGFQPKHPDKGEWKWENGELNSSIFGNIRQKIQPEYKSENEFGVLQKIDNVDINMQFENDGLRANVQWELQY